MDRSSSRQRLLLKLLVVAVIGASLFIAVGRAQPTAASETSFGAPGSAGTPYADMPEIAPIGARIGRYIDVPESAKGPPVDPAKGYRLQDLGRGLYMITDNIYQSMFLVYETGVVVVDAPTDYAAHIPQAIAEVTDKPVTHVIYSHSH